MSDFRLRFAPSPTGPLHIGGARSALFNYLLAMQNNGTFLVRMEDTDQERSTKESEENIKSSLKWLGMEWNEGIDVGGGYGPYRQMERLDIYNAAINKLLEAGKAYYCFCSAEELDKEREEQQQRGETPKYGGKCKDISLEEAKKRIANGETPVVRFKAPIGEEIVIDDMVRGQVRFETDGIGDFIIVKSDGIPVYNFAVVLDDYTMKISHIIRGEEHLSNTPRQIVIYDALGYPIPKFAHISLILGKDRTKMSKRHGSTSVVAYKEQGYLPEAIVNFLALMGWSPEGEEEILSLEEIKAQFSLDRVSKSPAVFDVDKLKWLNGMYIRKTDNERLVEFAVPFLKVAGIISENPTDVEMEWVLEVVSALKNHFNCFSELPVLIDEYREENIEYSDEIIAGLKEESVMTVLIAMIDLVRDCDDWSAPTFKKFFKVIKKETGIGGKDLFHPIRFAMTGSESGPDLDKLAVIMGKNLVLDRLNKALLVAK